MQRLPSVLVDVGRKLTTHGDVGIKDELPISTYGVQYILDVVGSLVLQYFPVVSGYAHLSHPFTAFVPAPQLPEARCLKSERRSALQSPRLPFILPLRHLQTSRRTRSPLHDCIIYQLLLEIQGQSVIKFSVCGKLPPRNRRMASQTARLATRRQVWYALLQGLSVGEVLVVRRDRRLQGAGWKSVCMTQTSFSKV